MFSFFTIENVKNNLREVIIMLLCVVVYFAIKGYVGAKDDVIKCQLSRVADYKDLRDQTLARMDRVEAKSDSNNTVIKALKHKVKSK